MVRYTVCRGKRSEKRALVVAAAGCCLVGTLGNMITARAIVMSAASSVAGRHAPCLSRRRTVFATFALAPNSCGRVHARICRPYHPSPSLVQLRSATTNAGGDDNSNKKPKRKSGGKKKTVGKIKINPNWRTEFDKDALAKEFDKMAKADGFDPSSAQTFHADDATFEDEFDYSGDGGDDVIPDGLPPMMSDEEMKAAIRASESHDELIGNGSDREELIDLDDFDLSDFEELSASFDDADDDDDFLDFGSDFDAPPKRGLDEAKEDRVASMADRIAAASRDMDLGRVSIDDELDAYARDVSEADLRSLGFRRETNPFGDDETPRKENFALVTNPDRVQFAPH